MNLLYSRNFYKNRMYARCIVILLGLCLLSLLWFLTVWSPRWPVSFQPSSAIDLSNLAMNNQISKQGADGHQAVSNSASHQAVSNSTNQQALHNSASQQALPNSTSQQAASNSTSQQALPNSVSQLAVSHSTSPRVLPNSASHSLLVSNSESQIQELLSKYKRQFNQTRLRNYNASGMPGSAYKVPNIVHFIRFGKKPINFVEAMCIKAAYLRQKPDWLIIHSDVLKNATKVFGRWWNLISTLKRLRVEYLQKPKSVFGRNISVIQHASDVSRIRLLMKYGGIYLDNDVLLLNSLDEYRINDFAVPVPSPEQFLGNQVLISNPSAPFLYLYYDTYHEFDDGKWYYNAGELPTVTLIRPHTHLVHMIPNKQISVDTGDSQILYKKDQNVSWNAAHLLSSHRSYLYKENFERFPEYDDRNIYEINITFTRLIRAIYEAELN